MEATGRMSNAKAQILR